MVNKNSDATSLSDVKSTLLVCNPQVRYSIPKKLASKPSRTTITLRKSPKLNEKANNRITESVRKTVLDFENEPTQPTQATVSDIFTGDSQGIVNLDDNSLGTEFWKVFSDKVIDVEEAANATKEPILHHENIDADDCHPED